MILLVAKKNSNNNNNNAEKKRFLFNLKFYELMNIYIYFSLMMF